MDAVDRVLLNTVQTAFPVEAHPYRVLGDIAGITEFEAWQRVEHLRQEGIIRRLGGVFDSHRLGYHSTLCAAKVPEDKIPIISELLLGITGVTHNYLRDHAYNMWFTVIASSPQELEEILNKVRSALGSDEVYSLPAIRLFKISVDFNFQDGFQVGKTSAPAGASANKDKVLNLWQEGRPQVYPLNEEDKALIRLLQGDLPHSIMPFKILAQELAWPEEKLLERTREFMAGRLIRRFGAVLRHQKAGFTANAMGVWIVPEDRVVEVGEKMAGFREVSHCYQRPTLTDWPYNLFTMIHGRSMEECQAIMQRISQATGIQEYSMLFSIAELKKSSMLYFMEEDAS